MLPIRIKACSESDLRMLGDLARNIQRVLPVTQADIDAAAALGKGWVVWKVIEVTDPIDNLRGGTQLVIKQNSITPGENVRRVLIVSGPGGETVVIGPDQSPLLLPDAIADSLTYVKAYGGTEQRNLPDDYIERQFIYMMDGSYLLTDIVPTYDGRVEMDFQTTTMPAAGGSFMGGRSGSYPSGLTFGFNAEKTFVFDGFSTNRYQSTNLLTNNTRYKYTWDNQVAKLETGGSVVGTNTFTGTGTTTHPLAINGLNNAGSILGNVAGIYLYSFKVWNAQGELVADYVPAVQKGAVPVVGFYDTVSKTFKTATSGTFAAGGEAVPTPDTPMNIVSNNGTLKVRHQSGLPLGYTLLESVVFDGTQEIGTGVICNNNTKIESKFYGTVSSSWVYGTGPANPRITCYLVSSGNQRFGNKTVDNTGITINTLITVTQDKNAFAWNGTSKAYDEQTDWTATNELSLGNSTGSTGTNRFTGNFYYMKIWDNNVLVRDYVAAKRNSDNAIGFYDKVNGGFITDAALTAGSVVSDPVVIVTDGTTETLWVHSKNLFDENWTRNTGVSTQTATWGQVVSATGWSTSGLIPVKAGQQYTISYNSSTQIYVFYYESDGTMQQSYDYTTGTKKTFTVPAGATHIRLQVNKGTEAQIEALESLLETGATVTTYEPYYNGGTATAEMLLKVGDYQDVQEILAGDVTRKVGVLVLDGTEEWTIHTSGAMQANVSHPLQIQSIYGICTHFEGVPASAAAADMTVGQFKLASTVNIILFKTIYDNTTSWKNWLADQYAAGTPVIVLYPLATEATETVAGQTLQVQQGNNIVEITQASIDDLEIEAEYQKVA